MNTSVDKSSKKRKSLGGQKNPPAKAAKLDESMQSPKKEKIVPANNVVADIKKSPKKQIKPENGISKKSQGPKTQGASDAKKSKNLDNKKKSKGEKGNSQAKKLYIIEKMQKRAETEGKEVVLKGLNEKIDAIISRPEVSKSGKKNLRLYKLMVKLISGEESTKVIPQKPKKDNKDKKQVAATVPKEVKAKEDKKNQKPVQKVDQKKETEAKQNKKNKQPVKKVEEEEEEEEEESSDDLETSVKSTENEEDSDDAEEEESGDDDEEVSGEEAEGSDDEDDDDDEEEDDDDDEEEDDEEEKPVKKVEPKKQEKKEVKQKSNENGQQKAEKKTRYVLFIGNIAYDTTKEELTEHFKKVGEVIDVRIPTDRESNRPRGFAYVELKDEAAYQKSLDLNGSQLKNRQIKVEYTQGQSDNEDRMKNIKAKNFKLHAMRQQGQGSPQNGQGRGGFRGNSRGGFRGNSRGSFRGNSRGSFRGQSRGGFRGRNRD